MLRQKQPSRKYQKILDEFQRISKVLPAGKQKMLQHAATVFPVGTAEELQSTPSTWLVNRRKFGNHLSYKGVNRRIYRDPPKNKVPPESYTTTYLFTMHTSVQSRRSTGLVKKFDIFFNKNCFKFTMKTSSNY